jgi:hypothetical protein
MDMTQRIGRTHILALICLVGLAIGCWHILPAAVPHANADAGAGKAEPTDQLKELQTQLADLKSQLATLQKTRIVAAGTATFTRPDVMDNTTRSKVKLSGDIAKGLGEDYIVLLTLRTPKGGYPYFNCYWKNTDDGFEIAVIDTTIAGGNSASYDNRNKSYLIDWAVIKK